MKPLYELLHEVESIRLAVYLLEPEPVDIGSLLKNGEVKNGRPRNPGEAGSEWNSGKWASNTGGFKEESQEVKISIGDENTDTKKKVVRISLFSIVYSPITIMEL